MACGTGKTYTALKIAETETKGKGLILVLVPSIALMGQTLRNGIMMLKNRLMQFVSVLTLKYPKGKANGKDFDTSSIVNLALPAAPMLTIF